MITTTEFEKGLIVGAIRALRAKRVLEIGAFHGRTTRVMADAVREHGGTVAVIDPMKLSSELLRNGIARHFSGSFPRLLSPRVQSAIESVVDLAGYEAQFWANVGPARDCVTLHRALSSDLALWERTDTALRSFDLVFIDGDHGYEGAKLDLERWGRRVRPGGLVLVHDATPRFPGVMRALEELSHDTHLEVHWPQRDSLCMVRVGSTAAVAEMRPAARAQNGGHG